MNQLQTFKNELFEVAVKLNNGEVAFDVEHVAKCLGITDTKNNKEYVRWNRVNEYLPKNSPQVAKGDFIPEPLVYKLAFKASNEVAEQFQDWLAIIVIPSIRKTGQYIKPLSEREQLVAAMKLSIESAEEIAVVKEEVKEVRSMVEHQITLDHGEQRRIQKGINSKVYELESDKEARKKLFSELHREIKDRFAVTSYKDIKRKEMQAAIRYIEAWVPRKVLS
jgi:prophage antirepressor-like protein